MNPAQPDYAFIVTVGLAFAVALSIAIVVLMQIRPRLSLHNLRIAWSVFFGIACVLLIAVWVRSYWKCDYIQRVNQNYVLRTIASNNGIVYLQNNNVAVPGVTVTGWNYASVESTEKPPDFRWVLSSADDEAPFYIPLWILTSIAAVFAAISLMPWSKRFSLRTLLIATTLVAVVLGLVVWLLRN
jgi:hypothetical protein